MYDSIHLDGEKLSTIFLDCGIHPAEIKDSALSMDHRATEYRGGARYWHGKRISCDFSNGAIHVQGVDEKNAIISLDMRHRL